MAGLGGIRATLGTIGTAVARRVAAASDAGMDATAVARSIPGSNPALTRVAGVMRGVRNLASRSAAADDVASFARTIRRPRIADDVVERTVELARSARRSTGRPIASSHAPAPTATSIPAATRDAAEEAAEHAAVARAAERRRLAHEQAEEALVEQQRRRAYDELQAHEADLTAERWAAVRTMVMRSEQRSELDFRALLRSLDEARGRSTTEPGRTVGQWLRDNALEQLDA